MNLPEQFEIEDKIYKGANSQVFKGHNKVNDKAFVLKYFKNNQSFIFDIEFDVLNKLQGETGFPKITYADKQKNCSYIILDYIGLDLELYWKK